MKKQWHLITGVEPGSIAEECGLEPGDRIGAINGHEIEDFFDYQYYIEEEFLSVEVLTRDDEECTLEIEKEEEEDLGLVFESFLMDEYNSCCNKCMFCFIDQMPPGMRDTLYFKDDDSRLSFLQGNYITLTNMKEKDVERVIRYHLAPINISVHTTNPELRCRMLHNRFAGDVLEKIRRFSEAGIPMNSQVVLCKGINDGEELDRTIRELGEFLPYMESLSVVPVGLTKYRDDLPKLDAFTREDAGKVLAQIQGWQKHFLEENGTSFVHASDEWFILAGEEFPPVDYYEGFGQLEKHLKAMAGSNVRFVGAVDNEKLPGVYRMADVFVLPSKSEVWGLVVEEALNNGTPVIVSDRVGCKDDLVTAETGLVFRHDDAASLKAAVRQMCDVAFYNRLRQGVARLDFSRSARRQVEVYLS